MSSEKKQSIKMCCSKKINVLIIAPCKNHIRLQLEKLFSDRCDFIYTHKDHIKGVLETAAIIIGEPPLDLLPSAKSLKWVQMTWAGTDIYTRNPGFPSGVTLTNASGAFGRIISEYVIGAILSQYRKFPEYWNNQKLARWMDMGSEKSLYGKKVLILGTGNVGSNIAKKLSAFDTRNIGIKRTACDALPYFDRVYGMSELDSLLSDMDIVIGSLPNTDDTRGLFNYERLCKMKREALLVNVGRGSLIVMEDLVTALSEGHLSKVILDVTEIEPLPETSPLWQMPNVMITPHISGVGFDHAPETEAEIWNICIQNLHRYLDGKPLENIVDMTQGY